MDSKKLIFSTVIIAIIFGNVYARKYTLHIIYFTVSNKESTKNILLYNYLISLRM